MSTYNAGFIRTPSTRLEALKRLAVKVDHGSP